MEKLTEIARLDELKRAAEAVRVEISELETTVKVLRG